MPVNLRYQDGEIIRTKSVLLAEKTAKFKIGGDVEWIFPDDGAIGYYRWSLPSEMLFDLALSSTERLSAPERIVFVGNAAALLDAGRISGADSRPVRGGQNCLRCSAPCRRLQQRHVCRRRDLLR